MTPAPTPARKVNQPDPTPSPSPTHALAVSVWAQLRLLMTAVGDPRQEVRDALGLSFIKAKALRRLERSGPLTLRELTGCLATDPPYTTLVVDGLEQAGLVQRRAHPTDRRAKQVHLTAEGHQAAQTAERILGEPPAPFSGLDIQDLLTLDRIITDVLTRAGARGQGSSRE
jgi:DNA-binding MarR family transcriptional regulator